MTRIVVVDAPRGWSSDDDVDGMATATGEAQRDIDGGRHRPSGSTGTQLVLKKNKPTNQFLDRSVSRGIGVLDDVYSIDAIQCDYY